ncbi:MAG: class I SAM-dependent methyltransferase [Vicinamibacterales bacterium]
MARDYSTVTETPDDRITREAASMFYSRYRYTRTLASGRRTLEVACGSGQGLGYLRAVAPFVVGADITASLLGKAASVYGGSIPLVQLDAERLPFVDSSFGVIALHEAIYYLPRPERFVDEAYRVLAPGGVLLVVSVNTEWVDFNPSPFATHYYSAEALTGLLRTRFQDVETLFGFPSNAGTHGRSSLVSLLKRAAVRLRLVPRTMRGKRLLKRLFLGPLQRVPRLLGEDFGAAYEAPRSLATAEVAGQFKVIYALGRRDGSR